MQKPIVWPGGKAFAFSVFDDTDLGTVENLRPVYDLLLDNGIKTTKSVWVMPGSQAPSIFGGDTCADPAYLKWVVELQKAGVEIGWHNATYHSSPRAVIVEGLERFKDLFGQYPYSMANHTLCRDGIYWGEHRVTGWRRAAYNLMSKGKGRGWSGGHSEGSEYFWGDLCKAHLKYVRNFVFADINTLKACPWMPYSDPLRPMVNNFFASSEGGDLVDFRKTISAENQDRLEQEGGCCIMYSHFAMGFWRDGALDPRFKALIERLGRKNCWFAPVTEVLDHIKAQRGPLALDAMSRNALECRWLWYKAKAGPS